MSDFVIRAAAANDADDVSALVVHTLREMNGKDYPTAVIDKLAERFLPEKIVGYFQTRATFVATIRGRIVATAGLEDDRVRMVFVHPARQGLGIGAALVHHIENMARERGVTALWLVSSRTAEDFYMKLGYTAVRTEIHDGERMTIMERKLSI